VFTARYALSPYIKQIRTVFKGLRYEMQLVSDMMWNTLSDVRLFHQYHVRGSRGDPSELESFQAMGLGRLSASLFQYAPQDRDGWTDRHWKAVFSRKDPACFHAPLLVCYTNQSTSDLKWNSSEGYANKRLIRFAPAPTCNFIQERPSRLPACSSVLGKCEFCLKDGVMLRTLYMDI
jgi:hypothetical protein